MDLETQVLAPRDKLMLYIGDDVAILTNLTATMCILGYNSKSEVFQGNTSLHPQFHSPHKAHCLVLPSYSGKAQRYTQRLTVLGQPSSRFSYPS